MKVDGGSSHFEMRSQFTGDILPEQADLQRLRGLDISSYQGKIDWSTLQESNIDFVFIKATEGATFVDAAFKHNIAAARAAKIPCGAYHFFQPKTSVQQQVNNFLKVAGPLQPGDLPPVLDLEVLSNWKQIPQKKRVQLIEQWADAVGSALQSEVILYMSASFAADLANDIKPLARHALWVAHYTQEDQPLVPKIWSTWTFWQYTARGHVDGIGGSVDLDLFNGNREQLEKFRRH